MSDQIGLIGGLRYTHQSLTDFTSADPNPFPPLPSFAQFGSLSEDNVSGGTGRASLKSPRI